MQDAQHCNNIVYLVINREKEKQGIAPYLYVGSKLRWKGHSTYFGSPGKSNLLYKELRDQRQNFELIILQRGIHPECLDRVEGRWHDWFDVVSNPYFYNKVKAGRRFTATGMKFGPHTEERKRKIGEKSKGRRFSPEVRIKMGSAFRGKKRPEHSKHLKDSGALAGERNGMWGKPSPNRGNHLSDETKKKLSDKAKIRNSGVGNPRYGCHLTAETRKKISDKLKGYKWGKERNKKISESRKGKVMSQEIKDKIRMTKQRQREERIAKDPGLPYREKVLRSIRRYPPRE